MIEISYAGEIVRGRKSRGAVAKSLKSRADLCLV